MKTERFIALALIHGKPRSGIVSKQGTIRLSDVPLQLRADIAKVFTTEEIHRASMERIAYDYAFWYRAEEKKHEDHSR